MDVASRAFRVNSVIVFVLIWMLWLERLCIVLLLVYGGLYHIESSVCRCGLECGCRIILMLRYFTDGFPRV